MEPSECCEGTLEQGTDPTNAHLGPCDALATPLGGTLPSPMTLRGIRHNRKIISKAETTRQELQLTLVWEEVCWRAATSTVTLGFQHIPAFLPLTQGGRCCDLPGNALLSLPLILWRDPGTRFPFSSPHQLCQQQALLLSVLSFSFFFSPFRLLFLAVLPNPAALYKQASNHSNCSQLSLHPPPISKRLGRKMISMASDQSNNQIK